MSDRAYRTTIGMGLLVIFCLTMAVLTAIHFGMIR